MTRLLGLGLVLTLTAAGQHVPRPLVVNPGHDGLPLAPAFDLQSDGAPRFIWNTYRDHFERLRTTAIRDGGRSRTQTLSAEDGAFWKPAYLADGESSGWAVWQTLEAGEWRVAARRLEDGFWLPIEKLSAPGGNALTPAAAIAAGRLYVAWEDHGVEPQQIALRTPDGRTQRISQPDKACYRPAIAAAGDGRVGMAWDCYEDDTYAVYFAEIADGRASTSLRLSGNRRSTDPSLWTDGERWFAIWIAEDDVEGQGALDQWHYVEAAWRRGREWSRPEEIADLAHSLLSRIEPEVGPIWGFAGRRLEPLIITYEGEPVVLWERKTTHDGRSTEPAELLAAGGPWREPVRLHSGLVQYTVPGAGQVRERRLTVAGFDPMHSLYVQELDLQQSFPGAARLELTGWKTTELPRAGWGYAAGERPSVEIGGVKHYLWWGDLHVHTGLTADAEGEVDELMHYARDKAKIDVVVMQENDAASWLNHNPQGAYRGQVLTESEYALSVYFSRRYTEPGRFVALAGWEWSDRTDDGKSNHRTVIFPGEETPLVRHTEEDDFELLCDKVEAAGGVMNTQHPDYRLVDRPCDANIEVAAGWGVYINQPEKIHADLSAGFKVGFIATSDGHRRNPGVGGGLTGFWAPELTPAAMVDALAEHRVYATNGSRVVLHATANGAFMGGDAVAADGAVALELRADAPRPILRAVLIRDGDEIRSFEGAGKRLETSYTDRPGAGFHWYYWRVEMEGESPDWPANIKVAEGHLAWTSPHRVIVR
jgi:hypothetical protein